jgi:cytochrome c oxidase cbb3-type subunit 2
MRNFFLIFAGVLFCIAFSWTGIVLTSHIQYGALEPIALSEDEKPYPRLPTGMAERGKEIYIDQGCMYCHSQQVRRKGYGSDFERGWGERQTVARDYILQKRVLLGTMRTGPDLMNVGQRLSTADWHHLHLYDPQTTSKGSIMPPFNYLYKKQKIGSEPSPKALKFPHDYKHAPESGYEIIPTERAEALVAYLLSLRLDYEFPEARFSN